MIKTLHNFKTVRNYSHQQKQSLNHHHFARSQKNPQGMGQLHSAIIRDESYSVDT